MDNYRFSITFGQEPANVINREDHSTRIINDFRLDFPLSHTYIIAGVRGSGKTVLMTKIAKDLKKDKKWICVDVNPDRDILEQVASSLYVNSSVKHLFVKKTFSFSFHGIGFSIEGKQPVNDIKIVLDSMLKAISKHNKKVLITIDEVTNQNRIRSFIHDYQSFLRDNLPVYLLMTGLVENVDSLQNNKSLTFLYRSPKIFLGPLDLNLIKKSYLKIFNISETTVNELTNLTKGYAFAYQVVGYLYAKYKNIKMIYPELDQYLRIYVYDKIYESIPESERKVLQAIAPDEKLDCRSIIRKLDCSPKEFSVYRDRLIRRGVVDGKTRAYLTFALPRFSHYIDNTIE